MARKIWLVVSLISVCPILATGPAPASHPGHYDVAPSTPKTLTFNRVRWQDLPAPGPADDRPIPGQPSSNQAPPRTTTIITDPPIELPSGSSQSSPVDPNQHDYGISTGTTPDSTIAVGISTFMLAVNKNIAILRKTQPRDTEYRDFDAFFNNPGPPGSGFDPYLIYDDLTDRYMAAAVSHIDPTKEGFVMFAISYGPDPYGTWCRTWWNVKPEMNPTASSTDYPRLGVDNEGVYISYVSRQFPNQTGPTTSNLISIVKSQALLNCTSATYYDYHDLKFQDGSRIEVLVPAVTLDTTGNEYLVSAKDVSGTGLDFKKQSSPSSPPQSVGEVDTTDYSFAPLADQRHAPGSNNTHVEVFEGPQVMNASYYGGHLWASQTTSSVTFPGKSAVRAVDITISGGNPTSATTTEFTSATKHYYAPAIMTSTGGRQLISFNFSSVTDYVGIMYADRVGSEWRSPRVLISGTSEFPGQRIGDYYSASADPASSGKIWFIAEFAAGTDGLHRSYWGAVP